MRLHTLDDATEALKTNASIGDMSGNYTLDRMYALMDTLDNPQNKIKVVHIAGTSGKTSTAYYIRALLEKAGKKVGLTVSPHITDINERVQIHGEPLPEKIFVSYLNQFLEIIAKHDLQPTYFEKLMAFAYWVFAKEKVDYAVIETGLGGLLDGSNTVSRADKVCVITDIDLEHTEILGSTLTEIAAQKAGIIQPGNHVIMHQQNRGIGNTINAYATRKTATIEIVPEIKLAISVPTFQQRNINLALHTYKYLAKRDQLPRLDNASAVAMQMKAPPGRMERYTIGNKIIILDGAHNPQKLHALSKTLKMEGHEKIPTILSFVSTAEYSLKQRAEAVATFASPVIIVDFIDQQDFLRTSLPKEVTATAMRHAGITDTTLSNSYEEAIDQLLSHPSRHLLITGSLYLIRNIRPFIIARAH